MLRSPLSWVGGKHRIREQILSLFPPHRCYVEPFAGAAWVLFGKDPATSESEVINDLDGELINFWRVLKHRPAEFTEAASWLLASRELWQSWRALPGVGGEILRAVRFYAVIRLGFGAQRKATAFGSGGWRRPGLLWPQLREDTVRVVARLRAVWIEHLPWEGCIRKFDGKEAFFYVDPPYHCGGSKAYAYRLEDEDHRHLARTLLGKVAGKWLLSYNDDPFIRSLYQDPGIVIKTVRVPYSIARAGRQHATELLIRNYSLGSRPG